MLRLKFHRDRRIQRRKNIQVIQYVYNIPAKAADALGKDQINFPVHCIGNHLLKAKALFDGRGADALVLIDFHQLPIGIAFNPLGKMPDLHIKTANLFFFLCADAAVRRNTQFWALLLRFPQLFWRNHYHAVAALIFRNLVLHELPPLFPAIGPSF